MNKAITAFPLLLAAFIMTACVSDIFEESAIVNSPETRVLDSGAKLLRYKEGPGRDITDIILEAELTQVAGECEVNEENVEVGLILSLQASKGPALESNAAKIDLIMAVTDQDQQFMEKQKMDIQLDFSGNRSTIGYQERFYIDIPLKEGQKSDDFKIYITFLLSEEELNFNKKSNAY